MISALFFSLLAVNTEHQIRLCDDNAAIFEKLALNRLQEKKAIVTYIETPSRDLSALGVSVRIRVKENKAEITVKKRMGQSDSRGNSEGVVICENDLHGGVSELTCKINATVDKNEIEKILSKKKNWLDVVSKDQLDFLKKYRADFKEALVYGSLIDRRYQWQDKIFGEITLDFVDQKDHEENRYNEISIRYPQQDTETGKRFEQFFKKTGIKACDNQIDWPTNKFDTLEILN